MSGYLLSGEALVSGRFYSPTASFHAKESKKVPVSPRLSTGGVRGGGTPTDSLSLRTHPLPAALEREGEGGVVSNTRSEEPPVHWQHPLKGVHSEVDTPA